MLASRADLPTSKGTLAPRRHGLLAISLLVVGLGFGGCAQRPQEVAAASHSREYFPSSIYGAASRRVVADGQPIPRGGGQYLVGKPYTIAGRTYYPSESRRTQVGNASWYGDAFHGRLTANGEVYDRDGFTAASPTMPLPSYARVTNLRNNYSMIVRVNDRGPYASDRIMDVSRRVAESLDFKRYGTTKLKVEYVARASLAGSDDAKLYASLRTNGPANWQGEPTQVAEAEPPRARVASLAPYAPERPRVAPLRREIARDDEEPPRFAERREPRREDEGLEARGPRHRIVVAYVEPGSRWRQDVRDEGYGRRAAYLPPVYAPLAAHAARPRLAGSEFVPPPRPRFARLSDNGPSTRLARGSSARNPILPPSRPMDLGTIPGAGSQIRARHENPHLRMARARDD